MSHINEIHRKPVFWEIWIARIFGTLALIAFGFMSYFSFFVIPEEEFELFIALFFFTPFLILCYLMPKIYFGKAQKASTTKTLIYAGIVVLICSAICIFLLMKPNTDTGVNKYIFFFHLSLSLSWFISLWRKRKNENF